MKAKALVQRLAHKITQLKNKTSSDTLHDKKVKRQLKIPPGGNHRLKP